MYLRELLSQSDPLSYALDHLEMIGRGSMSYVFAHPNKLDKVVKLSEDYDGWFAYAMSIMQAGVDQHAPAIEELGYGNKIYAGVMERLRPISEEQLAIVSTFIRRRCVSSMPTSLTRFIESHPLQSAMTDLREENWMTRGEVIVLTDPISRMMTETEMAQFQSSYQITPIVEFHP